MVATLDISLTRPGHASLGIEVISCESAVTSAFATNPMKLLTPRARGKSVWACTSSFGGGLVAGDQTRLEIRVGAGARCYLGTQASTKIYRNPSLRPCGHFTHATIGAGSLLVFAPDPVQAFAGSTYTQRQDFQLAPDASLVLLDWFTSGRAACGERWAFNCYLSLNEVRRERDLARDYAPERGVPAPSPLNGERAGVRGEAVSSAPHSELIFLDSICLDPTDGPLDSIHRTGRFNCFATMLLLGPLLRERAETLLADIAARPIQGRTPLVCSASPLRDGTLLRAAGEQVEVVARELRRHLAALACLLGDDPWARKW